MKTLILGHRGYKANYPENTMLSFEKALDHAADGIELDVHLTKDGELVVFHDFDLERMTGLPGKIFDFTWKELSTIHCAGQRIPHLKEVIDLVKNRSTINKPLLLNIELKAGYLLYPQIEEKTLALCDYLSLEQVIISSFDHYALKRIKDLHLSMPTGVLTTAMLYQPWQYLKSLNADYYHPHYLTLMKEPLTEMLSNQVKINTYTVNDIETAKQLIKAGVNSIITDHPEKMREAL